MSKIDNIKTGKNSWVLVPLQMIWEPKEDITAYELAMCIKYLNRTVLPYEIDKSLPHFRHFEIIDHN